MKTNRTTKITGILILFAMGFLIGFPAFGKTEVASSLPIRRFAIIVGSNDGGKERVRLQYAATDAGSFARVMETMGGLNKNDTIILLDPDYKEFSRGMNKLKQMLDGVDTGFVTPVILTNISPGTHEIEINKAGNDHKKESKLNC